MHLLLQPAMLMYSVFLVKRTFKQDCPVNISLRANAAGDALEVKSLCLEHSHDLSQVALHVLCYRSVHWSLL